jgi:hypothetical protein
VISMAPDADNTLSRLVGRKDDTGKE